MGFPIETERLVLRLFTLDDLEAMHALFSDAEVQRYVPSGVSPSLEVSRQRLEKLMGFQEKFGMTSWPVVEKASGLVVGDCGLFPSEGVGPEVELGYRFRRDRWGLGYATEAAGACLRYGLEDLKLPRIIAVTFLENLPSQRVLEKIGMTRMGIVQAWGGEKVGFVAEKPKAEN
jgi:RimJ/RimL family protein N-acetyltransferase